MPNKKERRVRELWQIALYVPKDLERKIKDAAAKEDRPYGPWVIRLIREHFRQLAA